MTEVRPAYVTDILYTSRAFPRLSPSMLHQVCLLNGVRPPPLEEAFTYCDLGCGQGMSVNAFAATFPQGRFWGVDLIPEHIEAARALAERAGLSNATFIASSFDAMDLDALPDFDYIVLNGVLSWVDDEVRRQIVSVLERKLRPGGALYVSFNALPGWAPMVPLRELYVRDIEHLGLEGRDRVKASLERFRFMKERGAPYFKETPFVSNLLEKMLTDDVAYLAHDYFNEVWEPLYFQRIVDLLGEASLEYVGSIPLFANDPEFAASSKFYESLKTARSRVQREVHLDVFTGRLFRNDVFVRAPFEALGEDALKAALEAVIFGSWVSKETLHAPLKFPHKIQEFDGVFFEPLLRRLEHSSGTFDALKSTLPNAMAEADLLRFLYLGLIEGRLLPFQRATSAPGEQNAEHYRLTHRFNEEMLALDLWERPYTYLVSRPAGNIFVQRTTEAVLLKALLEAGRSGMRAWLSEQLELRGAQLLVSAEDGGGLTEDERVARLVEEFLSGWVVKLVELDIIAPEE